MSPLDLTLYVVADARTAADRARLPEVVAAAARGGATAVQVRDKTGSDREALALLRAVVDAVPDHVPVVVNDRVAVLLAARELGVGVAGVHLGQDDLPVPLVRALVGPEVVIGLSASHPDDLARAREEGADHVGLGALRETATKPDAPPPLGIDGAARRLAVSPLPTVVIGGVRPDDAPGLRRAGAAGMAVSSGVCASADPAAAAAAYLAAWHATAGAAS